MRVWLLHIGEQFPVDGPMRRYRYGHLAHTLVAAGHEVLRWAPTFCHVRKTQRYQTDTRVSVEPGYDIQFVHAPGYARNTSLSRVRTYRVLGRRFRQLAAQQMPPDVILSAIPSLEWALAAVEYGRKHDVRSVIDVRDLWPDVFPGAMPKPLRPAARFFLAPYYRMVRRVCRQADVLAGISQTYLDWALERAGRAQRPLDFVAPHGFDLKALDPVTAQRKLSELRAQGLDPQRPICFFAGGLERHHEVGTIIEAARLLLSRGRSDVQFAICGEGSQAAALHEQARGIPGVHFLGWVDGTTLQTVAAMSVIGLGAYAPGALMSLGNKPFEYMAGRLAIISSLPGELATILQRHQCGLNYEAGSAESLAGRVVELLDDPSRLATMRDNSYQTWLKNYRGQDIYARFVNHLTSLKSAPSAAAQAA